MLALGIYRGRVMLVDEETGEEMWAVQAHPDGQSGARVAMSPDGRFVATMSFDDAQWKLWEAASGAVHRAGATHDGTGACICEVGDEEDPVVQEGCPVVAHTKGIRAVAFSPCSRSFATGGFDGTVIVWDSQTGEAQHRMRSDHDRVRSLSFSVDGVRLASASLDAFIQIWDLTTGALLRTIPNPHDDFVLHVHFSPTDQKMLASVGGGGKINVWDIDSGESITDFAGSLFSVFSPDGRTIATAGGIDNRDLLFLDAESGATRFRMVDHQAAIASTAFSVIDGSKLATGARDGTCKVWDASTGAILRTIDRRAAVTSVSFGRDWVRDTQRVAFAMGQNPRLGEGSPLLELEVGVIRMILDLV
jgi:WD40 repeat protein